MNRRFDDCHGDNKKRDALVAFVEITFEGPRMPGQWRFKVPGLRSERGGSKGCTSELSKAMASKHTSYIPCERAVHPKTLSVYSIALQGPS